MNAYPLELTREAIRNILERQARTFIVGRQVKVGGYEVHEHEAVKRNAKVVREGRFSEQTDPAVMTIEVRTVERKPLLGLEYPTLHSAGWRSFEDFYLEWLAGRRRITLDAEVTIAAFEVAEGARFLHRDAARGYTLNPGQAARDPDGAMQALGREEQERYSREARESGLAMFLERQAQREAASLHERLRELEREATVRKVDVSRQLAAVRRRLERLRQPAA